MSRAARDLYPAQPAVTRRVLRLETALEVALCDRRRRPFTLTEAGQVVLERCRRCSMPCALQGAVVLLPEGDRVPGGVQATRFGRACLVVVGPRSGLAAPAERGWMLNPGGRAARAMPHRAHLTANPRMRVAVETYTYDLQLALVARRRGLGLVPARILARSPHRSRLRLRRFPGLDFPLTIWTVGGRATTEQLGEVFTTLDRGLADRLAGGPRRPS